jgi:hypothetical protein
MEVNAQHPGDRRSPGRLQATAHTTMALEHLGRFEERSLSEDFTVIADLVQHFAPDCVGMSMCLLEEDMTFAFVATDIAVAELDAVQYLDGGPCEDAVREDRRVWHADVGANEAQWLLFAQLTAARGIRGTLSLPLRQDGRIVGSWNFYGSTSTAFDGRHDRLAALVHAFASEAVTNADLPFSNRERSMQAPGRLAERDLVDRAVGYLAGRRGVGVDVARAQLEDAAHRAGVSQVQLAQSVLGPG